MPEGEAERRSSWDRLFASSGESESERRVLEYIIHRMNEDGHLRDVVQEEYVRRNLTESQRQDIEQPQATGGGQGTNAGGVPFRGTRPEQTPGVVP